MTYSTEKPRRQGANPEAPTKRPPQGMTRWVCKLHGYIIDAISTAVVDAYCPCGRPGHITLTTTPKEKK